MAQGTITVNFGAFPGKTDATATLTGQTALLAGSLAEAWIFPVDTADHSADEHWVDPPDVRAGNVVAGVGITVYATAKNNRAYGLWNVAWVTN